jgi:hypothetical protein
MYVTQPFLWVRGDYSSSVSEIKYKSWVYTNIKYYDLWVSELLIPGSARWRRAVHLVQSRYLSLRLPCPSHMDSECASMGMGMSLLQLSQDALDTTVFLRITTSILVPSNWELSWGLVSSLVFQFPLR